MSKLLIAFLSLVIGALLSILLLELLLHVNPHLLFSGLTLPSPADQPLVEQVYDVRDSDGNLFYFHPHLVTPIQPQEDQIVARVIYQTDDYGFPNSVPLPAKVDAVVLGWSFSQGAQVTQPWPRLLELQTGLKVLNLSEPGTYIENKSKYLTDFGLPRHPKWVILEVLPSADIITYSKGPNLLLPGLPFLTIHKILWDQEKEEQATDPDHRIYPIVLDIPDQEVKVTFLEFYLSSLTVSKEMMADSNQWLTFRQGLLDLIRKARTAQACVVLLYAPTEANLYFKLAEKPEQLQPVLYGWAPWRLDEFKNLKKDDGLNADIKMMQANANAGRDLLAEFAHQHDLPFADPTEDMLRAARAGNSPFMTYDTHWSQTGHQIVAHQISEILNTTHCP